MSDDERTDEQRYEAGAERARRDFARSGRGLPAAPANPRRLRDVLPARGEQ